MIADKPMSINMRTRLQRNDYEDAGQSQHRDMRTGRTSPVSSSVETERVNNSIGVSKDMHTQFTNYGKYKTITSEL